MMTRRSFVQRAGLTAAVLAAHPRTSSLLGAEPAATQDAKGRDPLRLGIAGYTFVKFKLQPALEMTRTVDVHYLCIKDFHLPLNSTDAQIAAFHAQCQSYGVTGYGVG